MCKIAFTMLLAVILTSCNNSLPTTKNGLTPSFSSTNSIKEPRLQISKTEMITSTWENPFPQSIFDIFPTPSSDPTYTVMNLPDFVKTTIGIVHQEETIDENVTVDSTIGWVSFSLEWNEGDLDLILVGPDGRTSSLDKISKFRRFGYIAAPQCGIWKFTIIGKTISSLGSKFMLQIRASGGAGLYFNFDRENYHSGDNIKLTGRITDGIIVDENIHNVSMEVTVEDPKRIQYKFILFDDGLHGDEKADDGIYANLFTETTIPGDYKFYVQISGLNNRSKQPFTREYFCTTVVF